MNLGDIGLRCRFRGREQVSALVHAELEKIHKDVPFLMDWLYQASARETTIFEERLASEERHPYSGTLQVRRSYHYFDQSGTTSRTSTSPGG